MSTQLTERPADTPSYRRITREQIGLLLTLRKQGKTQPEIAQILGCSQSTVSKWLSELQDTREHAKEYLNARSLKWAQEIDKSTRVDVKANLLTKITGLESNERAGVQIMVGISLPGMPAPPTSSTYAVSSLPANTDESV